ncbi:nucleolar protein dao-5-like isoform X2 [Colossoma macropomum]|uniref:nucleolar protein dao-5-like isoform X2 n=1 Tax=Colossoma macropomum TaxID=42526 RepID=UPI001864CFC9|nr:nucleolar protein dao-5-like isoform X2 [Colossoma macropomum]
MTGIQPRSETVEDSSDDDEPLSALMKSKKAPERTKCSNETQSPGRSSDDEPLSKMTKSKSSSPASSDGHQESAAVKPSDSEDDQPLTAMMKKRKKRPVREETEMLEQGDANKTRNPERHKIEEKASKLRQASPSPVKTPQKRGRKGKQERKRMASEQSTPEVMAPKKRGRPKKEDTERKAPSGDGSGDDEPLVRLVKKKRQPQMKEAVVLLRRMSKSDVIDAITQGDTRSREQSSKARAGAKSDVESLDEEQLSHKVKRQKQQSKPVRDRTRGASSDDEPLVRRVKAAPVRNKCRKRTNGDTPKQESELGDELKNDSDDESLVKRKSDRAAQPLYRESSS